MDKDSLLIWVPIITFAGVIVTVAIGRWNLTTQLEHQSRHDFEKLRLERIEEIVRLLSEEDHYLRSKYRGLTVPESVDENEIANRRLRLASNISRINSLVEIYAESVAGSFLDYLEQANSFATTIAKYKNNEINEEEYNIALDQYTRKLSILQVKLHIIAESILSSANKTLIKQK